MDIQPSLPAPSSSSKPKKTEILYGSENAVGRGVEFMANVKQKMDLCFDSRAPSIVIELAEYRNGYIDVKNRGGKIRVVTEITKENLQYCRKLMDLAELRHLSGVRGGIAVNETEYMATTVLEEAKPLTEVIYSNVPEVVSQGQHIFDMFWENAIPAEIRINEIEGGSVRRRTKVIEKHEEVVKQIVSLTQSSKELSIVSPVGGMQLVQHDFFEIYKEASLRIGSNTRDENSAVGIDNGNVETSAKSRSGGMRWVTSIDPGSVELVKSFLSIGVEIRHVKNLPPISFALGDSELDATIEKMEGGRMVESLLTSNEPVYVDHFRSIFTSLWNEGIEAERRIEELEEGLESSEIEIIRNPKESIARAWRLIESAKKEVLILLSTPNAFRRQINMGGKSTLQKALANGCSIRILIPSDSEVDKTIQGVKQDLPSVDIKVINEKLRTNITILIIDKREWIMFELRDDTKAASYDAVGISLYSSSNSIVSSYATIIESLWTETELFEKLTMHDQMQRDFLDIATHELRTPIQPIIGLAEVLSGRFKDQSDEKELIDAITRNAKRLYRLTESLLDVTKIESKTLRLKMERFDLAELIRTVINDFSATANPANSRTRIDYQDRRAIVSADKNRIYQVISNILNNAAKFTEKGRIMVKIELPNDEEKMNREPRELLEAPHVTVKISDTGLGISPEVFPKLFSKFMSESPNGTGLGLYISKAIIEGHGGRIWAENNGHDRGATFAFSLPLARRAKPRSGTSEYK